MNGDDGGDGRDGGGGGTGASRRGGLAALLGAALRDERDGADGMDGVDDEGERQAVAAFQRARDTGKGPARTRRRDDWRPTDGTGHRAQGAT